MRIREIQKRWRKGCMGYMVTYWSEDDLCLAANLKSTLRGSFIHIPKDPQNADEEIAESITRSVKPFMQRELEVSYTANRLSLLGRVMYALRLI